MKGVSHKKLAAAVQAVEDDDVVTVRQAIRLMAPAIRKKTDGGYPRELLYRKVARKLGCSTESVARYYREVEQDEKRSA